MHELNSFKVLINNHNDLPVAFDEQQQSRTAIYRELKQSNDAMMSDN